MPRRRAFLVASRAVQSLHTSSRESALLSSAWAAPQLTRTAPSPAAIVSTALALVASTALTGTVAFAAYRHKMESAEAIKAEELYNDNSYDRRQLLEHLKKEFEAHPEDVGILWRLTRAAYDVANLNATPADEKKQLIYYAHEIIQKGLALTEDSAEVHNWFGIILSSVGDYEGSKVAIANSYKIKSHWEKAIELNPNKAVTYHLLGRWCIAIADLSWLERKAAAVLFGSPPESSYQEALDFLLKYENLDPLGWKKNVFLIAQVYYKMKDWANAKEWTQKALDLPIQKEEDQTVHDEAAAMMKKL